MIVLKTDCSVFHSLSPVTSQPQVYSGLFNTRVKGNCDTSGIIAALAPSNYIYEKLKTAD